METKQLEKLVSTDSVFSLSNSPETEIELCDFYGKVLKTLFANSDLNFSEIRSSLGNMRSYKNPDVIEELHAISFNDKCDRLAYIFAYGVIHSVIIYDRFSNLLKSNPSMLQKIASMNKIRLCFLGGGPALELTSFIKLLSNILTRHTNMGREPLHVYATIIDMCIDWKEDAELILEATRIHLCNSSNIQIHFRFIEADLTEEFDEKIKKAIKNSHIVTMVKFLSDVKNTCYSIQPIPNMIDQIIEYMSFKACLFYLDTSGGDLFSIADRLINKHELTARIYGPCLHNGHFLGLDSIQKLSETLGRIFRHLKCTSRCKISCSAWLKVRTVIEVDGLFAYANAENVPIELSKLKKKNLKAKKKRDFLSIINSDISSEKKSSNFENENSDFEIESSDSD